MKKSLITMFTTAVLAGSIASCSSTNDGSNVSNQSTNKQIPRVAFPEQRPYDLNAMKWRFIGPMTGLRGSDVKGHPTNKNVFYHAANSGLWITTDAGDTWEPLGDGQFGAGSMGSLAISQSNPDIMYAGTGEPQMRNNVSWGDGVYKTTDAGKTWTHLGLKNTKHISQVLIHPNDNDTVYVSGFGSAFGPSKHGGVFKTTDGGKTWQQVLFKSETTGVIDLVLNPSNPNELFASVWEFERKAWGPKTGGPGSALMHSTDGGKTWADISRNPGLPEGDYGRIGITMSAADPNRVYILADNATKGGVYRSDDNGKTWEFTSDFFQVIGRPFYYSHIIANPGNADELWSPNNRTFSSQDAGKTWRVEPGIKDDFHDVWIDPEDANRMIRTSDGGVGVTLNGGMTWSTQYTQKNAQFYRVNTDNEFPYNVYASSQDSLVFKVPSADRLGGISQDKNLVIGNGETSSAIPDPDDNNVVFLISSGQPTGGGTPFTKANLKTGQAEQRSVLPDPIFGRGAKDMPTRHQWDTSWFISEHNHDAIYVGANVVFKSMDEGQTWTQISDDLTNDYEDKQVITGTPWLPEYFGQEVYSTIARIAESPLKKGMLWTGSDDGLIHLTMDDGKNWKNVTIPGLPKYSHTREIEPSHYDAGTAYIALSNYNTTNDYKPYLFKTTDYGKTWTDLSSNFPQDETIRTVREDTKVKGLLYAGTETGIYVSMDDGQSWKDLGLTLPSTPVVDIEVKDNDLVIATNGRGFFIMDDITPLRADAMRGSKPAMLFNVQDHTRFGYTWWLDYAPGGDPAGMKKYFVQNQNGNMQYYELGVINGEQQREWVTTGEAKPRGVKIYFELTREPTDISLSIANDEGKVVRTYTKDDMALKVRTADDTSFNNGLNKFVWDMRWTQAPLLKVAPIAKPGKYTVKLEVDGETQTSDFMLNINPNETYSQAEIDAKYDYWMDMYQVSLDYSAKLAKAMAAEKEVIAKAKVDPTLESAAKAVTDAMAEYKSTFIPFGRTLAEIINQPAKLFSKITWLHNMAESSEGPPNNTSLEQFETIKKLMVEAEQEQGKQFNDALKAFNAKANSKI
ncbi:hypothetical protein HR060_07300 [Catenovulum sp. SM1970]|uniref:WD40/YVTN/BNR-like repeat-containing protein n=1 Tax=Marinifaba aquimaris TaxID=2741323 RepID=UPI00157256E7|nr:YCF48-related protein [Marinifaba aquimaris]NTS76673.1 hypothetical protein [Marinifaba aquimaris]